MAAEGFTSGDPRKLNRTGYTKGDVVAANATGALTAIPVGVDTEVLTADSTDAEGVDWAAGGGGGPAASGTVVTETSYGQASTAGVAATYSRGDHTHGTPATPTAADVGALPTSGGTVTGNLTVVAGDLTASDGVSTFAELTCTDLTATGTITGISAADVGAVGNTLADAKGDLIAASAADTWTRVPVGADATVLTADSTQAAGVRWAAAGTTVLSADSGFIETGNQAIDNAAFVQLGPDLTVDAAAGDILVIDISVMCSGAGGDDFQFEAATRVAAADTNWWSSGGAASRWPGGVPNWYVANGRFDSPHGSARYVVQAGDIVAGQVTVRLYGRATGAAARTVFVNASYPLRWHLTNLGPGT